MAEMPAFENALRRSVSWLDAEQARVEREAEKAGETFDQRLGKYGLATAGEIEMAERLHAFFTGELDA